MRPKPGVVDKIGAANDRLLADPFPLLHQTDYGGLQRTLPATFTGQARGMQVKWDHAAKRLRRGFGFWVSLIENVTFLNRLELYAKTHKMFRCMVPDVQWQSTG
jgi:hypothetical protein